MTEIIASDGQKTLLGASFLLQYPNEEWYEERSQWQVELETIGKEQWRSALIDVLDYTVEQGKKEYEEEYVRAFDFSKNTHLYLSSHEFNDQGKQAEELIQYKAFYMENGVDVVNELPDYLPALLELCGHIPPEKSLKILQYAMPKLKVLRERLIEGKLPQAYVLDVVLSVVNGWEEAFV